MSLFRFLPERYRILARIGVLEEKTRYLVVENMRMNEVIRELIYKNNLSRSVTGMQTRESFDYQWREVPEGESMPSNPDFLAKAPEMLLERVALPREWFPGKKVLDAGCGSGRWSYALAKLGADVTAIDQSAGALAAAKKLVEPVANGKAQFLQKDLLNLDLPKEQFDLVWNFGVCHHTENLLRAMVNVMSMVKPGGRLFMMLYGFPLTPAAFATHAEYEEWRQKLLHLSFKEKVEVLRKHFSAEQVHGYFDALSPLINDLVTWEWTQAFVQEHGFEDLKLTIESPNHHFVARKKMG